MGYISDYGKCITVPVSAIKDVDWVVELEDIEKDTGRLLKRKTKSERTINGSRHAFTKNQILFSKLRTYLNKVLIAPDNGYCTTEIIPISPYKGILPEYLNLVLRSPFFLDYTAQCGYGVKMPRLGTSDAIKALIPIPPFQEQRRIVESLDKYSVIIERILSEKKKLIEYLTNCKSVILDLAIHGRLVPQVTSDEPAIELLRRINPGFKPSDNLHYEGPIPVGWQLTKMGDLVDIISGTSYQKTDIVMTGNGIRVVRGGNIQNGGILLCDDDVFINASLTNEGNTIHKGDIAIVASTGSSELIGKAAIATRDYPRTQIGAFLRIARPKSILISEYLGVIFQSDYYKSHIKKTAKGTNINNIKTSYLTDFIIPIPPREEQERIMCKIRGLLAILNQITDSVNSSE